MSEIPKMFDVQGKQLTVGSLVVFLKDAIAVHLVGSRAESQGEIDGWFRAGDVCMLVSAENYKPSSRMKKISRDWTNIVTLVLLAQKAPMALHTVSLHVPNYLKVLK